MKRWSATPVSKYKNAAKKLVLITVTVLFAITPQIQLLPHTVKADEFEERINRIQSQIDEFQQQASQLNSQADSLQKELNSLTAERYVIEQQVDLRQAQFDKLNQEIADTQKKIADNQDALGDTLANLYVASDVSPLEMLASSKSFSDYIDQETFRNTIKDNIVLQITNIKDYRKQLIAKKKEIERVLAEQKLARDALIAKENQQADLVAQTRGQQAAYQRLASDRETQKLEVMQEQQAAIEAALHRGGGSVNILPGDPNKGGYPWESGCWLDDNAWSHGGQYGDGTDPLGYGCRQCVSYAAWKVGQRTGSFPYYWGNANQWPVSARAAGYSTGTTPRVNSVGVISAGQFGHVVWIEAVNDDGTVDVSQYNYYNAGGPGWGNYSKMRVSAATYDTYIYF